MNPLDGRNQENICWLKEKPMDDAGSVKILNFIN